MLTDFKTVRAAVALPHFDATGSANLAGAGKEGPKICDKCMVGIFYN